MKLLSADPESYRAATRQAKADRKRLWKNFEGKKKVLGSNIFLSRLLESFVMYWIMRVLLYFSDLQLVHNSNIFQDPFVQYQKTRKSSLVE